MATPNPEYTRDQYLEKPLPSSPESERVILGAILLDNQLISQAIEVLKTDDFYSPLHRRVFRAMSALFERGERIDPIMIAEELKKDGGIDAMGGVATITNLTYGLPHFSDIFNYAKVVKDKSIVRNLIKVCNQITSEALAEEEDASDILDHAEQMIFALADERTRQGFAHVRPVAETVLAKVQEFAKRESHALTGISTGFRDLDEKTSGLQRTDLIIVAARPSMGKCLSADQEIVTSDGSVATIGEIYRRRSAQILTLRDDFKFALTEPSDFIDDGLKPVFKVRTRLGREIETTVTHPFLTINGWTKLEQLKPGCKIAVPRVIDVFGELEMRECEVKILAYLLGDGCLTKSSPEFTVGKPAIERDFIAAVDDFGGVEAVPSNSPDRTRSLRIRKSGARSNARNPLTVWLQALGVYGLNSHGKYVPAEIFRLKKPLLALFLNRLFATDGWACVLASGQVQLGFASVSEKMIRQVQHLLLRFGVIARLKRRAVKYKEAINLAWQLDLTDAASIRTFIHEIGIAGKEEVSAEIVRLLDRKKYQTNRDLIPVEIWARLAAAKGAESWASLARRAGIKGGTNIHVGKRAPTRERLARLAATLGDETLVDLARSEIYWDEIASIEYAGEKQVYDLTIPETHNFVAGDICVHNTALCLTLAQNAAILERAVVAVFSLEMSKEQLVMRMLSSEAKVDAHRFRTGYLTRDEWGRLAEAIGTLSEAKIFIDDTPGISVLEMRAKCRRLATEQKGIDLIVVDYLQLMSGSKRSESRQQEVSQISRELKALAKELNVPIIALSQLSRAPEARNPPKPMMSDLRESGCLTGESLITMADSGERIPIRDLVGKFGFRVWALNEATKKIEKAIVTNAFCTGTKPVFRLRTRLGREIRATGNHKFFRFDGWKRLDSLAKGDRIALPREIKNESAKTMRNEELALLAHLIGDGCALPRHTIQYTTRESELAETVAALAKQVFGDQIEPRIKAERSWYQVYLASTRKHARGTRSAVAEWLDDLQVWGLRSYEKRVPEKVFGQPRPAIALFLRHLWATDGCLWMNKSANRQPAIHYATTSRYAGTGIYKQNISRERAFRLSTVVQSEELSKLAVSDIYWDEVVEIIPDGEAEVFDLTVDEHHNFVANGIIVHNSIEQDADVVAFIYREDYYKPSEENAGLAELLIAKQRNGPTGTVRLAFLKEFTRFENYYGEYSSDGGE